MKKILVFLFLLFNFIFFVFAENNFLIIYLNKNNIDCNLFIDKKINNEIINLIYNGYQATITYEFLLFKKNEGFLVADSLISKVLINYNLASYNNKKLKLYNLNSSIYFDSFQNVEKYLFQIKIEKLFSLNSKGKYYVKSSFNLETIKLVPPFSLILIFFNLYNIRVDNLLSNIVEYD
jgi:hypothetical protein